MNRKTDDLILAQLNTATLNTGTAGPMTKRMATTALVTLWNNNVPNDGNTVALITPAAWGYLSEIPEFASSDYVGDKPNENGPSMKKWMGATWVLHTGLSGIATSAAKCIVFHKSAIGYGYAKESIRPMTGFNDEQDYYWVRSSMYMGAKLLQNNGVVIIDHDDTGLDVAS